MTRATYWLLVGTRGTYSIELKTPNKIVMFVSCPWLRVLLGCGKERILPGFGSKLQMILSNMKHLWNACPTKMTRVIWMICNCTLSTALFLVS